MRAAVFVRYNGANGLGHLAWAFDSDTDLADCGSVENPEGKLILQPVDIGFWTDSTKSPIPDMTQRAYNDAKYIDLLSANPAEAYSTVLWIAAEAYKVVGRNCLDDVYDVLSAYGVSQLPPPAHVWEPNEWFDKFTNGTKIPVSTFDWSSSRQPAHLNAMFALPSRVQTLQGVAPKPPSWRIQGTPAFNQLQQWISIVTPRR
jgi:hypothetical protein